MRRDYMKIRGFEVIKDESRIYPEVDIQLPIRGDSRSAGYDLRTPVEVVLQPNERKLIFTDVKAYMNEDEVLEIHVRSSIGVKKNIILSNITGIIDSSYYSNMSNDGNIGLTLWNTSDEVQILEAQERVCQCVFKKYLISDNDICLHNERIGGFGSSGIK
jgi:dUTP pyrophosphatase